MLIVGFLVYFESELLNERTRISTLLTEGKLNAVSLDVPSMTWLYSIGNYFLAAAQGFFRSLPSAIFLFSSITNSQANILPVVVTNHTVTIAAELVSALAVCVNSHLTCHRGQDNGERLVGQCEISHPVAPVAPSINFSEADLWSPEDGLETQRQNVMFEPQGKDSYEPLPSRISSQFYFW